MGGNTSASNEQDDPATEHVTIKVWVETRKKLNQISAYRTARNPSGVRVPMTKILDELADEELARMRER